MRRFMLLMHGDTTEPEDDSAWEPYLAHLRGTGRFEGGSSLSAVAADRTSGSPVVHGSSLVGYLVVQADDLDGARTFLAGNPIHAAGGTVEFCELLQD